MRVSIVGDRVIVALSQHNLKTLLESPKKVIERRSNGLDLTVHVEEDEVHYNRSKKEEAQQ